MALLADKHSNAELAQLHRVMNSISSVGFRLSVPKMEWEHSRFQLKSYLCIYPGIALSKRAYFFFRILGRKCSSNFVEDVVKLPE